MSGGGRRQRSHSIEDIFVFLLLGMFAVFSTMIVLFGVQAYNSTADAAADHNAARILHAYVFNAMRADDAAGAIELAEIEGVQTLNVVYDYGMDTYIKRIYCYDGELRELFVSADREFNPQEGEGICDAQALSASMDGDLLTVTLTDTYGSEHTASVALRAVR